MNIFPEITIMSFFTLGALVTLTFNQGQGQFQRTTHLIIVHIPRKFGVDTLAWDRVTDLSPFSLLSNTMNFVSS